MGWSELSTAAGHGISNVAGLIEDVVETIGDFVTDLVETVGNAIEDGFYALGKLAAGTPGVGGFLRGLAAWLGGVLARIAILAGAAIKGAFGIVAGAVGGLLKIVFGALVLQGHVVVDGLIDIGSNIAGAVIYVAGALASLVQRLFFLQGKDRALTQAERDLLHKVFRGSLGLYNVRLIEGRAGAFAINNRPFTLGNTIYMKSTNPGTDPQVLVHECTHVWQYQNVGARYTMDALGAQAALDNAYDWQAEVTKGHTHWSELNKEAQAELVEDGWIGGTLTSGGTPTVGHGAFYDLKGDGHDTASFIYNGTDHTGLATDAVKTLRGRINARLSRALMH